MPAFVACWRATWDLKQHRHPYVHSGIAAITSPNILTAKGWRWRAPSFSTSSNMAAPMPRRRHSGCTARLPRYMRAGCRDGNGGGSSAPRTFKTTMQHATGCNEACACAACPCEAATGAIVPSAAARSGACWPPGASRGRGGVSALGESLPGCGLPRRGVAMNTMLSRSNFHFTCCCLQTAQSLLCCTLGRAQCRMPEHAMPRNLHPETAEALLGIVACTAHKSACWRRKMKRACDDAPRRAAQKAHLLLFRVSCDSASRSSACECWPCWRSSCTCSCRCCSASVCSRSSCCMNTVVVRGRKSLDQTC